LRSDVQATPDPARICSVAAWWRAGRNGERGALVAGVEDAPDARGDGGVDRRVVQAHRVGVGVGAGAVGRDEQQLVGAGEGGSFRLRP
jgi:hypothetical protein